MKATVSNIGWWMIYTAKADLFKYFSSELSLFKYKLEKDIIVFIAHIKTIFFNKESINHIILAEILSLKKKV